MGEDTQKFKKVRAEIQDKAVAGKETRAKNGQDAFKDLNKLQENLHNNVQNLRNKLLPQIIIQSVYIVLTALVSNIFTSWVVRNFINEKSIYLSTTYESLGTLVLMVLILVPINTATYRRKVREIRTLSNGIEKVAGGDFDTQIKINKREEMAPVYENFNKMAAELSSVQLLRNDFINSYSHEFKTPIASINGFASLLIEKDFSKEEERQYLEIIKDESERLSKLATNTIMLSKLSSQQIVSDMEEYNLGEQLRQCAIIISPQWMEKNMDFSGDFPDISFKGNKELMQHLWLNIMGNCVKYTGNGGKITAKLEASEDTHTKLPLVVATIEDNGQGMASDVLSHLFDPYYQGDASHAAPGLGLGLSIAKRIVELCEGSIEVESEVSVGSKFIIKLPNK